MGDEREAPQLLRPWRVSVEASRSRQTLSQISTQTTMSIVLFQTPHYISALTRQIPANVHIRKPIECLLGIRGHGKFQY